MGAVFRVVSGQSFPYLVLVCMLISQLEWIPVAFSLSFSPSPSLRAFSEHVLGWKIHKNAPIRSQCSHCDTVLKHQQETSYSGSAWEASCSCSACLSPTSVQYGETQFV